MESELLSFLQGFPPSIFEHQGPEAARHIESAISETLRQLDSDTNRSVDPEVLERGTHLIREFIEGGHRPPSNASSARLDPPLLLDLEAAVENAGNRPAFPPQAGDTEQTARFKRAASILAAVNGVLQHQFRGGPARTAASAASVAVRNLLSVFLPTLIRQLISHGLEHVFQAQNLGQGARTAIGAAMPLAAIGALAVGGIRDYAAGTATATSTRSRIIMALSTLAAGIASASTGAMADSASTMMAFTGYTTMRDLMVQAPLRLNNRNMPAHIAEGRAMDAPHFAAISLLYGIYQGLVNRGMTELASPSGAGVVGANLPWSTELAHAAIRGVLNWFGENSEDASFATIPLVRDLWASATGGQGQPRPLDLHLSVEPSWHNVANGLLGPWAVRTGILSMTLGLASIAARAPGLANNPGRLNAISDLIVGGVNAVLYEPFANAGSGQPGPSRRRLADPEADPGRPQEGDMPLSSSMANTRLQRPAGRSSRNSDESRTDQGRSTRPPRRGDDMV